MKTQFSLIYFLQCFFIITVLAACNGSNAKKADESLLVMEQIDDIEQEIPRATPPPPTENYTSEEDNTETSKKETTANKPQNTTKKESTERIKPMLIKNGQLNVEVDDVVKFRSSIGENLKKYEAYISNEEQDKNYYGISNTLTIRVPAAKFDSLLAAFESEKGKITHKSISVQDVTAEYLDIAGRLKTRKEVRARYQALLGKANKVSEIIEIEEAARKVQEEIEAAEGRMKYLRNQASFSTLTLYISQKLEYYDEADGFWHRLINAFENGWQGFLTFLIGLAHLWIFLILGSIAFYLIRKRYLKNKKK